MTVKRYVDLIRKDLNIHAKHLKSHKKVLQRPKTKENLFQGTEISDGQCHPHSAVKKKGYLKGQAFR